MAKRNLRSDPPLKASGLEAEGEESVSGGSQDSTTQGKDLELEELARQIKAITQSSQEASERWRREREDRSEEKERLRKEEREYQRVQQEAEFARQKEAQEAQWQFQRQMRREELDRAEALQREMRREEMDRTDARQRELLQDQRAREEAQIEREQRQATDDRLRREAEAEANKIRTRLKVIREMPPLARLKEPKEIVHFLGGFVKQMTRYEIEQVEWPSLLKPILDQKSAVFMERLTAEYLEDWETLSKSLIEFNGIDKEFHRKQWEGITWRDKVPPMELFVTIRAIGDNVMEPHKTRDEVIEHMCVERYLNVMPVHVSTWLRERAPKNGKEAASLTSTYLGAWSGEAPPRRGGSGRGSQWQPRPYQKPESAEQRKDGDETARKPSDRREYDRQLGPRCFRCHNFGHLAAACPDKEAESKKPVPHEAKLACNTIHPDLPTYSGSINGTSTQRLVRDTGCNHSMVNSKLIDKSFTTEGTSSILCVHGDERTYPLITVTLKIRDREWRVKMAVADLGDPDALLGNDIPELDATIRHGRRKRRRKTRRNPPRACTRIKSYKERSTSPETSHTSDTESETNPPADCDPSKDAEPEEPPPPTSCTNGETDSGTGLSDGTQSEYRGSTESSDSRSQHTEDEHSHTTSSEGVGTETSNKRKRRATKKERQWLQKQRDAQRWGNTIDLNGGRSQMKELQEADPSLASARASTGDRKSKFFWKAEDGLLYRKGTRPDDEDRECHQLVLPSHYRENALRMSHIAPLAGHFGVAKTSARLKGRFHWPGLCGDVRDMCRRCQTCQKTTPKHSPRAPLVPLPVIRTPFSRLAMDMVGPLYRPQRKAIVTS